MILILNKATTLSKVWRLVTRNYTSRTLKIGLILVLQVKREVQAINITPSLCNVMCPEIFVPEFLKLDSALRLVQYHYFVQLLVFS